MTTAIRFDQIAIREEGRGSAVVALHGSLSDSRQWRSLTGWLSGRHRVIAPDLPGYGGSRRAAAAGAPSLKELAECLRPLIVGAEPVHLVGHSFGGAVALKAACLFPGHVRSLTLIEPAAFGVIWTERGADTAACREFTAAASCSAVALAEGDAWAAAGHFVDFWNGAGAWNRTSFMLRRTFAAQAAQLHADYAALRDDVTTATDLAGVVCPALSLRGARSPAATAAIADHLSRTMPFLRHVEIEGAGHMLPLTDPHLVDPLIGDFLAKIDSAWQDDDGPVTLAA